MNIRLLLKDNLARIVSGTAAGHLINLIAIPVLARVYSPDQYGIYALFLSFCSVFMSSITLRLEFKLHEQPEHERARFLVYMFIYSLFVSLIVCLLFYTLIFFDLFRFGTLDPQIVLVAFSFFVAHALFISVRYFSLSHDNYKAIATLEVSKSATRSITQIGLGLITPSGLFMAIGDLLSRLVPAFMQLSSIWDSIRSELNLLNRKQLKSVFCQNWSYSSIGFLTSVIDAMSFAMIIPMLNMVFSENAAGEYSMIYRLLALPMALVGLAVSDTLQNEFLRSEDKSKVIWKYCLRLTFVSLVLFSGVFLVGGWVFNIVLGEQWVLVPVMIKPLSLLFFCSFVVSPISRLLFLINKVNLKLIYDSINFLLVVGTFFYARTMEFTLDELMWTLASLLSVNYLIYFIIIIKASGTSYVRNNLHHKQ